MKVTLKGRFYLSDLNYERGQYASTKFDRKLEKMENRNLRQLHDRLGWNSKIHILLAIVVIFLSMLSYAIENRFCSDDNFGTLDDLDC